MVLFEIELIFNPNGPRSSELEMRKIQKFELQISIHPKNDAPIIEMGPVLKDGKALRIASGTSKLLTNDLIHVVDPDSTKTEITISIVPISSDNTLPGHIENQRFPGQARDSFTLEDLEQERVSFVHDVSYSFF